MSYLRRNDRVVSADCGRRNDRIVSADCRSKPNQRHLEQTHPNHISRYQPGPHHHDRGQHNMETRGAMQWWLDWSNAMVVRLEQRANTFASPEERDEST
jgi:hypothetical protein